TNDPAFPKRLNGDLNEVQAWWFYKQNMWDSAAIHLANALDNASNRNERARWEYLAGQLYEMSGKSAEAQKYYSKVIGHTTDPVMEVYARLNSIRVNKSGGENYVEKNIDDLIRMAKRERYEEYRDIIYYMAAQMQLARNNISGAEALLKKSIQYNSGNVEQRNKAFLQLAEMAYANKLYRPAYNYYDSLNLGDPTLPDTALITKRKEVLGKIVLNMETVERQDSLQHIAAMPEQERKDFVKKLVKDLRKQQGLNEEGSSTGISPFGQQTSQNLFSGTGTKGDWYFYNQDARMKGRNDFIAIWSNRPNVDNWRRSSAAQNFANKNTTLPENRSDQSKETTAGTSAVEITFDDLYNKLPLTPDKIKISDDSISTGMFNLGKLYAQEIEDCAASIETLENLRHRFPGFTKMDEVLFNLFYCYNKAGETAKADEIKKLMGEKYPSSNFTTIVVTGKNPLSKENNPEATKEYEKIYDLFIEGNFAQAVAEKKMADSLYGKNYWTPQLLYIEAVYYIKQRDDSVAKKVLSSIISQFPGTQLADKATTLIDVLSRRSQIEKDIQNWAVQNPTQDNNKPFVRDSAVFKLKQLSNINKSDSSINNKVTVNKPGIDTAANKSVQQNLVSPYSFAPDAQHYVMIILTKVDPIFSGEAKNAFFRYNRQTYYNKTMTADIFDLDAENRLLLISPFRNAQEAIDYIGKTKPLAPSEIIPWLKGGKYTFSVITDKNLDLLKANKDLENYKKFLSEKLPGKF
ncbi:MAG TPA: hypothetical protein VET23_11900, partial [Chitinophagaceae bacterium]|nr:hypothetical protein [Chitinophagaceae bacterium]